MAANAVAEEARERETFRYDSSLINQVFPNPDDAPIFPSELTPDPSLTAFAELGVHRLNACRAFVSLFDRQHQYIVAEATPTTPLSPGSRAAQQPGGRDGLEAQLLLWGTSLPRSSSICDHVLTSLAPGVAPERLQCGQESYPELPVTVIGDLENHPFMEGRAAFSTWPAYRFYAGVPLRTSKGIDIGVFSVLDLDRREKEDPNISLIMQDISRTIMGYLETRRFRDGQRRADRMVKGVGSFVQGKSTTSGWEAAPCADEVEERAEVNPRDHEESQCPLEPFDALYATDYMCEDADSTARTPSSKDKKNHVNDASPKSAKNIFSKAAKIIRESIEVDGVLFLDAGISSFGGRATIGGISGRPDGERRASAASMHYAAGNPNNCSCCKVLGFSTSYSSSIDGHDQEQCHKQLPEHALGELLKMYSRGTIISLNELNTPNDATTVSDEATQPVPDVPRHSLGPHLDLQKTKTPESTQPEYDMEDFVRDLLPGARNVAFFPLWDHQKRRWYAGGFAYTKKASRVLSVDGELSYLLAFGTVIMAEVFRIDSKVVEQSKMDVLSSISHELRSPLHGIILGAELLHDTALDAFQGDLLHSMETCSRTLLDTVDHLLDWSGVNNFLSPAPVPQHNGDVEERGLRSGKTATIESGMMSIVSRVSVDLIVEEVVESVYAGRIFQLRTLGSNLTSSEASQANELIDCLAAQKEADISTICVDIEPNASWEFYTQPGALRRVVMNLVGNSLKFTTKGFVKVSLDQPHVVPSVGEQQGTYVRLTVTDSGCGIGKSYLENDVFTPFIQEDGLKPGMGLGLSFVERIVTALKGSISIQSVVDKGTSVSVTLPLPAVVPESAIPRLRNPGHEFEAQRNDLRGLRVLLLGFRDTPSVDSDDGVFGTNVVESEGIANICRDWLQMQVVEPSESNTLVPDLLLCDETYLHLNSHIHTQRNASSPPAVVICRNAVSARDLAENRLFKRRPNDQLWEFSAQPVGPRKLAKVLALTFKRWTTYQATLNPIALSAAQTPEEEDGPRRPTDRAKLATATATAPEAGPRGDETPELMAANIFREISLPERVRRSTPLTATYPDSATSDVDSNQPGTSFLLVDDNPINLKILTTYMKKLRLPYRTATNGQQAVDLFREANGLYKCVFMDISMPVMDGFEATRHIRSTETEKSLHRCTIFALTGLASADAQQEAFTSGIDLFLTKPVKLAELSQILLARFGAIAED
ncbi:ATPase-like, ATP-binding domain protein [Metarhizium album ARSEF 1941]|uniref:ATPase-like, ATP-binding domain protein n=1 Tax=Metarhizium album (strain ARSEF 1941) TaxID=1081103 RepID=A0A0B2WL58_METAS|nr:ATPase-like, ATP-binding domain protein [Metarhizium album ARSEF 1941]KHN94429.1 ATPase-like, ATP-binding domain protein [Metarhizium album ARSEF 1941]